MRSIWLLAAAALALPAPARAMDVAGHWAVKQGTVKYEVSHILHEALGTSHAVQGGADCTAQRCTFHFSVALDSFDSGDADRDRDMLAVVDAVEHPRVEVQGTGHLAGDDAAVLQLTVRLAGASVELPPLRVTVQRGWWSLQVHGAFPISLQTFHIPRPALLGVPISDTVRIYVDLSFGSA